MQKEREDVTNNLKKGKEYQEYKRIVYWCLTDDIWISIETPLAQSRKVA